MNTDHAAGILTPADIERNRNDPGAYRARSIAFKLPAIIDYLSITDATYRKDIDPGGTELEQAIEALTVALGKAKARGRKS